MLKMKLEIVLLVVALISEITVAKVKSPEYYVQSIKGINCDYELAKLDYRCNMEMATIEFKAAMFAEMAESFCAHAFESLDKICNDKDTVFCKNEYLNREKMCNERIQKVDEYFKLAFGIQNGICDDEFQEFEKTCSLSQFGEIETIPAKVAGKTKVKVRISFRPPSGKHAATRASSKAVNKIKAAVKKLRRTKVEQIKRKLRGTGVGEKQVAKVVKIFDLLSKTLLQKLRDLGRGPKAAAKSKAILCDFGIKDTKHATPKTIAKTLAVLASKIARQTFPAPRRKLTGKLPRVVSKISAFKPARKPLLIPLAPRPKVTFRPSFNEYKPARTPLHIPSASRSKGTFRSFFNEYKPARKPLPIPLAPRPKVTFRPFFNEYKPARKPLQIPSASRPSKVKVTFKLPFMAVKPKVNKAAAKVSSQGPVKSSQGSKPASSAEDDYVGLSKAELDAAINKAVNQASPKVEDPIFDIKF